MNFCTKLISIIDIWFNRRAYKIVWEELKPLILLISKFKHTEYPNCFINFLGNLKLEEQFFPVHFRIMNDSSILFVDKTKTSLFLQYLSSWFVQ
jgi:hypothetical protein